MAFELAYSMFKVASIFSLDSVGRGDVLCPGNPFKERDTWKEKVESMELKCTNLQKELAALQEEVKPDHSLQESVEIVGTKLVISISLGF